MEIRLGLLISKARTVECRMRCPYPEAIILATMANTAENRSTVDLRGLVGNGRAKAIR